MTTCRTCRDTKTISVAVGDPYLADERGWVFARQTVPCPECTEEGQRWADEENTRIEAEYAASLAAEPTPFYPHWRERTLDRIEARIAEDDAAGKE